MENKFQSNKQVQDVTFSRKRKKNIHPLLVFSNNIVPQAHSQKHLRVILDFKKKRTIHSKSNLFEHLMDFL